MYFTTFWMIIIIKYISQYMGSTLDNHEQKIDENLLLSFHNSILFIMQFIASVGISFNFNLNSIRIQESWCDIIEVSILSGCGGEDGGFQSITERHKTEQIGDTRTEYLKYHFSYSVYHKL